jgi:hypothetical protein
VNAKELGTMTLEQFSDRPWPAEGRTLGEIIERLVGPEIWVYLLDWTGDRLLPSTTNSNHKEELKPPATRGLHAAVYTLPRQRQSYELCTGPAWHGARFMLGTSDFRIADDLRFPSNDHRYRQAVNACLPFLDAWNSGTIIAKARGGGPLEPLADIPAPRAGYTLTVRSLLNSVIVDSTTVTSTEKRYFDVRFFPPERALEPTPLSSAETENTSPDPFRTGTAGRPTAKEIVLAEAGRRIRGREVLPEQGGLTAFSESLETWWEQERQTYKPPGPSMTASGIRNCGVRDLWNSALKGA